MAFERTCIVCRKKADKRGMQRLVIEDGAIRVDPDGKAQTRGCYVCGDPSCIDRLQRSRALERAFRRPVSAAEYARIAEQLHE